MFKPSLAYSDAPTPTFWWSAVDAGYGSEPDRITNDAEFAARYGKRLAIVVPYRDRAQHLAKFVPHIAAYFEREKLDRHIAMSIHVLEQHGDALFNIGKLRNCGFAIAAESCDYVCFHDVDYLPIWADYSWSAKPARLIWYGLQLIEDHDAFFGAVVLFDNRAFRSVNGYPNAYWGWGPEDREMGHRCKEALGGFDSRDGLYTSLPHPNRGLSAPGVLTEEAKRTIALYEQRLPRLRELIELDGLSQLKFKTLRSGPLQLNGKTVPNAFHHLVDIGAPEQL